MSVSIDSPTSTMMRIPIELLRPIVNQIEDRQTLMTLSLANKICQSEAERVLYNKITKLGNVTQHISFLTTIVHNTRLASLVRTFYCRSTVQRNRSPLWGLIKRLEKMVNLQSLTFRESSGQPSDELLDVCTFQLHSLHWMGYSEGEKFGRWLTAQPTLKRLTMEWNETMGPIPKEACPMLEELVGNRKTLEMILPGRRVVTASWLPELDDSDGPPESPLSDGLSYLRTLSFGGYFSRPTLDVVARDLTSVEILGLVGLYSSEELDNLKRMPKLREVVISFTWGGIQWPVPSEKQEACAEKLFAECPKLVTIDLANQWDELGWRWYHRWTRGSSSPVKVELNIVRNGRFIV